MTIPNLGCYALGITAAATMLAGCGGSQPPIGVPGAMPQSQAIATHAAFPAYARARERGDRR